MTATERLINVFTAAFTDAGGTYAVDSLHAEPVDGDQFTTEDSTVVATVRQREQRIAGIPIFRFELTATVIGRAADDADGSEFRDNCDAASAAMTALAREGAFVAAFNDDDDPEMPIGFQFKHTETEDPSFDGDWWTASFKGEAVIQTAALD